MYLSQISEFIFLSGSIPGKYTVAQKSEEMQRAKGILIGAINHLRYHLCLRTQCCAFGNVKSLDLMVLDNQFNLRQFQFTMKMEASQ